MKHPIHSLKNILPITACVVILCWNGSNVDTNNDKRPDVNFYGTLTDHKATYTVEDILIGKRYELILFYVLSKPSRKSPEKESIDQPTHNARDLDPKGNPVKLSLDLISNISVQYPDNPIEHEIIINNQKYTEITVTLIDNSKTNYMVESSRVISCIEIKHSDNSNTKDIVKTHTPSIIQIKSLDIKGHRLGKDAKEQKYQTEKNNDKVEIANNTEKILDQIEEKVKNLPQDDPSQYQRMKDSVTSLLRSLRDQLQKMLNLIKG